MPLFSIIMPTRNRAHLLRYSLQSALEQTFEDYEIVVSDNYSQDETAQVVEELGNTRVRYVRTDKDLLLSDNWEFALSHAHGEYVTFLPDDDAFSPRVLETAAKIIKERDVELVVRPYCYYHHSTWYDSLYKNTLLIPPFTAQVYDLDALSVLTDWFTNFGSKWCLPTLTNSIYHHVLIDRVRSRVPRLIPVFGADIFSAVLILSEVGKYCYLDSPVILFGRGKESISASLYLNRGSAGMAYLEEFSDQMDLQHVPLRMLTRTNLVAETLFRAKKAVNDNLQNIESNWGNYFVGCYQDLMSLKNNGVDISEDLKEFHQVLAQQPLDLQQLVHSAIASSTKNPWERAIRNVINRSSMLRRLELLLRPHVKKYRRALSFIRGENAGFNNILECARKLDVILKRISTTYN